MRPPPPPTIAKLRRRVAMANRHVVYTRNRIALHKKELSQMLDDYAAAVSELGSANDALKAGLAHSDSAAPEAEAAAPAKPIDTTVRLGPNPDAPQRSSGRFPD